LGLYAEHRRVNVVVGQIHNLVGCFMVELDSGADRLNVCLGTPRGLTELLVVKQVLNKLLLVHIQEILVLLVLSQDFHGLLDILFEHRFDLALSILNPRECLIDGEVRLWHSHK